MSVFCCLCSPTVRMKGKGRPLSASGMNNHESPLSMSHGQNVYSTQPPTTGSNSSTSSRGKLTKNSGKIKTKKKESSDESSSDDDTDDSSDDTTWIVYFVWMNMSIIWTPDKITILTLSTLSNFNGFFYSLFCIDLKRSVGVKGLITSLCSCHCLFRMTSQSGIAVLK